MFAIWFNVFTELSVYMSFNKLVVDNPATIRTNDRYPLSIFFIFLDCLLLLPLDNYTISWKFLEIFEKKLQKTTMAT